MSNPSSVPIEWVPGSTRDWYFLGLVGVVALVFAVGSLVVYWVDVMTDPAGLYPIRDASLRAMASGIVPLFGILAVILYVVVLSIPAGRLGLSPAGVRISRGMGYIEYPWERIHVFRNTLYAFAGRHGVPSWWQMTPEQTARVAMHRRWWSSRTPGAEGTGEPIPAPVYRS